MGPSPTGLSQVAERQTVDMSGIAATIHPACHYHKLVGEDAIYAPEVYGAQRSAIIDSTTACGR